jgi:predicted PurR-regulated permease PerM
MIAPSRIEQTITLALLALLVIGCFFVLRPFLSAILWAAILAVTVWPLHLRIRARMPRYPSLAALIVVVLIAIALLAPFLIVGATIAENADRVAVWLRSVLAQGPPEPPAWVARLPLIGRGVSEYWGGFAHDTAALLDELKQFVEPAQRFAVAVGTSLLGGILQLTLSVVIVFFVFRDGDALLRRLHAATDRIAGPRGRRLALAAATTVQGVVIGILGTAIAQGVLAAIGFAIAGIKAAPLLGFVTFLLSAVPVGPPIVWIPAGIALINQGATGWGIFVLLWGLLVVSSIDNVIKPLLISRGSDLPFVLVLLGVLGGVVAFGFIGVFLGPVLLAVGYALIKEWAVESATDRPANTTGPPQA